MSPPTWQHMPRLVGTSRTVTWLARLTVLSVLRVNRDKRLTPVQVVQVAAVPLAGAALGRRDLRKVGALDRRGGGVARGGEDGDRGGDEEQGGRHWPPWADCLMSFHLCPFLTRFARQGARRRAAAESAAISARGA